MFYTISACFHCKEDFFYVNSNLSMNWRIVISIGYFCLFGWICNNQFMTQYDDIIFIIGIVIILSLYYGLTKTDISKILLIVLPVLSLYFTFSNNSYLDKRIHTMISLLNNERLSYLNDNTKSAYYKEIQREISASFLNEPHTSFSMMVEIDRMLSETEMLTSRIINYSMHSYSNPFIFCSVNFGVNFYDFVKKNFFVIFFPVVLSFIIYKYKIVYQLYWVLIIFVGLLAIIGCYYRFLYLQGHTEAGKEILGIWPAPEPRISFASFAYKNHWSAYVILVMSVLLYLLHNILCSYDFIVFRSKRSSLIFAILIVLIFSILYSSSNSGLIFIFLFLILSTLLIMKKTKLFIIVISLSVACALLIITNTTLIERLKSLISGDSFRFFLWKDLYTQIQLKTFWGYGINSYKTINGIYQSTEITNARLINLQGAHQQYIPLTVHAHSDFLQTISEIGFTGTCIFIFPLFFALARIFFISSSSRNKFLTLALSIVIFYSIVDFPFRNIAVSALFVFLLSINLLSQNRRKAYKM